VANASKPAPEPMEVDDRLVLGVATALWVIALLVLAFGFHHQLNRHHAGWWLWTCVAGIVMGGYGVTYFYVRRRPRLRAQGQQRQE
jgi:hypothetical protein